MHSSRGRLRAYVVRGPVDGCFLVWWVIDNMVWTNPWLSLQVQVAAWLVLVQVKNKHDRSLPVRPLGVEKTCRLCSRDLVTSGDKCGPHGGNNGEMKSWTVCWQSLNTKVDPGLRGSRVMSEIGGGVANMAPFVICSSWFWWFMQTQAMRLTTLSSMSL
jgi:hypothetical protein